MQSRIAAAVRRAFDSQLKAAAPQFERVKILSAANWRVYRWGAPGTLTMFLILQFHAQWEWFTVEAGWSRDGTFPDGVDIFESPFVVSSNAKRFRLVTLWDERRKDFWWQVAPMPSLSDLPALLGKPKSDELLPKVDDLVQDAVRRVSASALPYFERVRRGELGEAQG